MSSPMNMKKVLALAAVSLAALFPSILSANNTTVLNCSASCSGLQQGCCSTSTGKCKYRASNGESWRSGEVQNGNCVIEGKVVGKMPDKPADKDELPKEKDKKK